MASVNVDDDYESDPEEAKMLMTMRRRVATDDEEEEGGGVVTETEEGGSAEDYDDLGEEEDELVRVEDARENEVEVREGGIVDVVEGGEEGKKEHEPFAVPTGGAFYMHDDRFREKAAGRIRTLGAQKLWESKDKGRWGHDKFEELTSHISPFNESRRNSRGRQRGRGRNQGSGRGYARGNGSKMPEDYDNQAPVSTNVKGRGPKRYTPAYKHRNQEPHTLNKQSGMNLEISSHSKAAQRLALGSTVLDDAESAKKYSAASNLNSASPPFYPSGTSNMDVIPAPKLDMQPPNTNRSLQPPSVNTNLTKKHTNTVSRWMEVADSSGLKKLSLEDTATKHTNEDPQVHPSGFMNPSEGRQVMNQGRGQGYARQVHSKSMAHPNQASKLSRAEQHATKRHPLVPNRTQLYSQSPAQLVRKQISGGSQVSSSPPGGYASTKSFENVKESQSESSESKIDGGGALGPFMYNGTHIMGASMSVSHGDQNFPAYVPVMQFGAQHPGGIGVPAMGMAFPGYVQPQHGQGSSEMTWLPVLAGATGALGANYCPPYMLDGSSYNQQLADSQFVSSSSDKLDNANRTINEWGSSQKLEHSDEGFEQRQSKPRRYSEMKFGQ